MSGRDPGHRAGAAGKAGPAGRATAPQTKVVPVAGTATPKAAALEAAIPRSDSADLRGRAEGVVGALGPQDPQDLSPEETRQTLHELRVHQIELEMQNEELRRAQLELEASRSRYFDLYDLAPVGYCTIDEKGLILEANLTSAALLSVTRDTLVKRPLTHFILPVDQDIYYHHRKTLFATGAPQTCELRLLRSDEPPLWANLEATIAQDGEGAPVCLVAISDISKRKQAEEALGESQERYRLATENVSDVIWIVDLDPMRFAYISPSVKALRGLSPDEVMTADVRVAFTPASWTFIEHVIPERLGEYRRGIGKTYVDQIEWMRNEGDTVWTETTTRYAVDDRSGRTVIYGVSRDISERKFQEDERELMAQLTLLVDTPGDLRECMSDLTASLQGGSGCEAVGIRLRAGDDYPYYQTLGFPPEFVRAESHLCVFDQDGKVQSDGIGNPMLECMCGNILCGRFDPAKPFFTAHGSFWSNSTTALLASTTEADRQAHTRNRCNSEGYESVALVPLRTGDQVLGLLQFNDRRRNRFTPGMITHFERIAGNLAIALLRRQAEDALREREERLRTILQTAMDGFWLVDTEGRLLEVNETYCRMSGYSAQELLTMGIADLDFAEAADDTAAHIREIIAQGEDRFESRHRRKDGSHFDVEISVQYRPTEDGRFVAFLRDITERKRAQEALRESEAKYRGLFAALHEMVAVYEVIRDHRGTIVDRKLVDGNQALVDMADVVSIEDILGKTPAQIFGQEYSQVTLPRVLQAMESRTVEVFESHRFADGVERHYITSMVPLNDERYLATGRDITSIKETENALRQSRRRAELLANTVGALLPSDDPQPLVEDLCRQVMEELDCQAFFNFLADDEAGRLHLNAYAGIPEEEARLIEWLDYGAAICGCAAQQARRIVAEDISSTRDPLTDLVASYGFRAYACHPLMAGERVIGTLSFGTRTRGHFREEELTLMKAAADHVSSAMTRARAEWDLRASEQRYRELAGELEVERSKLAAAFERMDVGLVFTEADGTFVSMNAKALGLHGFDPGESMLALYERYMQEFDMRYPDGRAMPVQEWPTSRALRGEFVHDYEARVRKLGTGDEWIGSYSAAPVLGADGQIVLLVFSIYDLSERRRLEDAVRNELETSQVLLEAASTLAEWTESVVTLGGVVRLAAAVSNHSRVGLHIWHAQQKDLELVAATGAGMLPVGSRTAPDELSTTSRRALWEKRTLVVDYEELAPDQRGLSEEMRARLALAVPILHRGSLVGLLSVDEPGERREFTERQIELVRGIAAQAAVGIENARLYDAQRHIATVLQEQFIHPLPEIEDLELAVVAVAAHRPELVGGDFHDVFELPHGHVAVLMGDVEGKGISAAALSETVRSAVRALAIISPSPRYILNNVNRLLLQQHSAQYVTALLTIIDPVEGLTLSASAGHPAPIHVSAGTASSVPMMFGVPLGALPWDHEQVSYRLAPGDSLVFYTDGLSEARRGGLIFGEQGVLEVVRATAEKSPQDIAGAARDAAVGFAGRLQDDMQLIVLRFAGRGSTVAQRRRPGRLNLVVPDAPWRLIDIRGSVRDFLAAHAVEETVIDDLVMSVEEACTNALRHSHSEEPTEVQLSVDASAVDISVRDYGCGFDTDGLDLTQLPDPLALGGRGLYLIRSVVDELELLSDGGTVVHMRKLRTPGAAP